MQLFELVLINLYNQGKYYSLADNNSLTAELSVYVKARQTMNITDCEVGDRIIIDVDDGCDEDHISVKNNFRTSVFSTGHKLAKEWLEDNRTSDIVNAFASFKIDTCVIAGQACGKVFIQISSQFSFQHIHSNEESIIL